MSANNEEGTPREPGGEELLTRKEVARRLRVHPSTVDNWRKFYGLPTIEKGNKVYFDWEDVKAWLRSGPMKAGRRKRAVRSSGAKRGGNAGGEGPLAREFRRPKPEGRSDYRDVHGVAEERRVAAAEAVNS